jgi:phosphatidylserine/phosphatidylglycerophosphate/cardiolipin synthase-like enzyme
MSASLLDQVIAEVARSLPLEQVEAVASFLDAWDAPTNSVVANLCQLVPNPGFAGRAGALGKAWLKSGGVSGPSVALALRSTALAVVRARNEERIETVWTGPTTKSVPLRQTLGVLLQVVKASTDRLVVVSFAAYKVAAVVDALLVAAARGVKIAVVIDESTDAGNAFAALAGVAKLYCWPAAGTALPNGGIIRMHVKAAVADDHTALVGSANLTGQGMSQNMELGLLVEGGDVPRQLDSHFRALIASEVLVPIDKS